jgi:hypothetical protein
MLIFWELTGNNSLAVLETPQREDVFEIDSVDWQLLGDASRSQNEFVILNLVALAGLDGLVLSVDLGDLGSELKIDLEVSLEFLFRPPSELASVGNEGFGQLGPVERCVLLLGDQRDGSVKAVLSESFDRVQTGRTPSDDDNLFILGLVIGRRDRALGLISCSGSVLLGLGSSDGGSTHLASDSFQVGCDEDLAVLDFGAVGVQAVESGSILDITGTGVEAGSVPGTGNSSSL